MRWGFLHLLFFIWVSWCQGAGRAGRRWGGEMDPGNPPPRAPSALRLCCLWLKVSAQNSRVSAIKSPESPRGWIPKHVTLLLSDHRESLCVLLPDNKHKPIKTFQGGEQARLLQSSWFAASFQFGLLRGNLFIYSCAWQISKVATKRTPSIRALLFFELADQYRSSHLISLLAISKATYWLSMKLHCQQGHSQ